MLNVSTTLQALLKQRGLTAKAIKKLEDDDGKPLSPKLRGLLGLLSSGKMPQKLSEVPKSQRAQIQVK